MPEAPPATFRCNPKKRILTIRVALHHVHPSQVDLHTSATRIKLSTRGRRQLSLVRGYPNGMTCDDAQTEARMDGHTLVVELPIVVPPAVVGVALQPVDHRQVPRARRLECGGPCTWSIFSPRPRSLTSSSSVNFSGVDIRSARHCVRSNST